MAVGQFPCLEDEGSEESSPQVVGLTEGGGASEGMHPRLHDPRRRSAPRPPQPPTFLTWSSKASCSRWACSSTHLSSVARRPSSSSSTVPVSLERARLA